MLTENHKENEESATNNFLGYKKKQSDDISYCIMTQDENHTLGVCGNHFNSFIPNFFNKKFKTSKSMDKVVVTIFRLERSYLVNFWP